MTARPEVTKDDIKQLFASLVAEEEYFDKLGQLPPAEQGAYESNVGARAALMRSAGVQPGPEFVSKLYEGTLSTVDENLKCYACDFIKATYLMLGVLKVPSEARDFILILMAASGGNSKQRLVMTDVRLGQLSGYDERTIRRKREAYLQWENKFGWIVIRVHERPRDSATKHYLPTEYEVFISDYVAKFVREWRSFHQSRLKQASTVENRDNRPPALWGDMERERAETVFAEVTTEDTAREIAERVIGDHMKIEPSERRQTFKPTYVGPSGDELSRIETQLLQLISRGRDVARRRGKGAFSWWSDMKRRASILLAEKTPGCADPED